MAVTKWSNVAIAMQSALAAAIQTEVIAGRLEVVLFSDMA